MSEEAKPYECECCDSETSSLRHLAVQLYRAKRAEEDCKKARIEIENQILSLVDMPEVGSRTFPAGELKLSCKKELSYTVDERGLFAAGLPDEAVRSLFEEVPATLKFVPSQYEDLKKYDPDMFAEVSKYVTVKPKKPSVTIKL